MLAGCLLFPDSTASASGRIGWRDEPARPRPCRPWRPRWPSPACGSTGPWRWPIRTTDQPALRGRAASGEDLVVPQPAETIGASTSSSSCPTRSTGATRRACSGWRSIPSFKENRPVLRLLLGQRRGQAALGGLAVPGLEGRPAPRRPGERAADLGLGRGPVREPQRRHDRLRPGRLPLHHAGRRRAGRRSALDRARTRATGSARSCGSTSIIPPTASPTASPPTTRPAARKASRPLGARGLLHRPAERLEVQLRPPDRRALGRRRRPEPLGDGPPDRERRQLRLEHPRGLPRLPAPAQAAARPGRPDPSADRRVSARAHAPTARTTA